MDQFPHHMESPLPSSEQREIQLERYDILDIHHALLEAADTLFLLATPDRHERTATRVPLNSERPTPLTAGKWQYYTSLSAVYLMDSGEVSAGMTFTTPQVWDSIDVKMAMPDVWNVTPNGMPGPITTFRNEQLLRLLDEKIEHNPGMLNLIRRLPTTTTTEFPAEMMNMLEPLAKINTDIRTYRSSDYMVVPGTPSTKQGLTIPDHFSETTAEIIRADGVEAIDYVIRTGFDGLPIQTGHPGSVSPSYVANTYEHRFSVPHKTGLTEKTRTTFSVTSSSSQDTELLQQYVQSSNPEMKAGDAFRRAIQLVIDNALHP